MACPASIRNVFGPARSQRRVYVVDNVLLKPSFIRSFASVTASPITNATQHSAPATNPIPSTKKGSSPPVLTTLYSWPTIEPQRYAWYGPEYLDMPLRKDILHRAVIYEADSTRRGTASTKWRSEVHGSNRKLAPQKGLGRARVGDKKSPIRRGGGVAFGPKPRDFSTELPKKVYDIAWRTALSYRYRRGELILLNNSADLSLNCSPRFLHNIFSSNHWGRFHGRSLVVSEGSSATFLNSMAEVGEHAEAKDLEDVDIKDLLKFGRVIIDSKTLNMLFAVHSHDLGHGMTLNAARARIGSLTEVESRFVHYSQPSTVAI